MFCPSFPETEPEVTITPCPESDLQEVRRVDVSPHLGLVLCPGAEGYVGYYRYPGGGLDVVEHTWASGVRTHRGRNCLEVFYRSLSAPVRNTWGQSLLRVTPDEVRRVYHNSNFFYAGHGPDFHRGNYVKHDPGERRLLRVGDSWEVSDTDEEGVEQGRSYYEVDGPYALVSPAGSWSCVRHVERWADADEPESGHLGEHYVADSGRTLLRRDFDSQVWLQKYRPKSELLQSPQFEHHGVSYFLSLSCYPDFVLGIESPDLRWPQYVDKWPPRPRPVPAPKRRGRKVE